jgi:citrate lyase subunit beta/citryl-CoA lyase
VRPPLPVHRLRSWLFVEGASEPALAQALASEGDVLIQELEDFTPPELRPRARELAPPALRAWRDAGKVAAARINPLDGDGLSDLEAVMCGRPHAVLLPKAETPAQIRALEEAVGRHERALGIAPGETALVPNVETARGLMATFAIATASPRVVACLVASEDMATDLGAERARDAWELDYVRARFHLECTAAGVLSIDCPYTFTDADGCERDVVKARRLGYQAKSTVLAEHAAAINAVLTPSPDEVRRARRVVEGFEAARGRGEARVEVDGSQVEVPIYLNALRLLERARALADGKDD